MAYGVEIYGHGVEIYGLLVLKFMANVVKIYGFCC
jgi:hypothetical protein